MNNVSVFHVNTYKSLNDCDLWLRVDKVSVPIKQDMFGKMFTLPEVRRLADGKWEHRYHDSPSFTDTSGYQFLEDAYLVAINMLIVER